MTHNADLTVAALMAESGVQFGTSGARGLVSAMTDRVCHGYTQGFLRYLAELGEFAPGSEVALAGDLRPSTPRIMAACAQAVRDMGGVPVNCGLIPTPALAWHAFARSIPSLMVTGSHIPDDRNGIKFYHPHGELLKNDEPGMSRQDLTFAAESFGADGALIDPAPLPAKIDAETAYVARYVDFFGMDALTGLHLGLYQHTSVARDLLVRLLEALGAHVTPLGRAEKFVPVDTEAVRDEDVELARQWAAEGRFDAIASTDGDADRPLLAGRNGAWLRGDVLGVLCARQLGAGSVVTPVSSNSVVETPGLFSQVLRTRIGSPYVIAAMDSAIAAGAHPVCGYEANGGFLLGSPIEHGSRRLAPLPTRDAVLPIVSVLVAARANGVEALVASLPPRATFSDRIKDLPTDRSRALLDRLSAGSMAEQLERIEALFGGLCGRPETIDQTDGLRIRFADGRIIHLRPSGNAPELRCYTEAEDEGSAQRLNIAALRLIASETGI